MSIEFTQPGYIYVWKQTAQGDIYVSRHRSQEEATESVLRHVEANGDGEYRIETPDRFVKVKYVVFKRPATEPPSPPTGLVILSLDAGTAVLDWNNNPETNITSYRVYYSQNGISFELYSSPSISTASVTGLAPAITHFFKVSAFNSAGQESAFSSTVSGADTVPPAIPTGLLVVPGSITGSQLALDWNNNTDTDFAYYRVYQSTNQSTWTNISGDITNSVHVATGLLSETTYYFRVAATDTSGNESAPTSSVNGTTLDITAPANATNFAILESSTTASTMFMTWTASVSADVAGYKIYRSTDGTNYTLVATLGLVTNYEDTGLTANTLYYYKISAIDEVPNESALSSADSYTTLTSGLTWINDSVPFPLSIQAGSYHDLEQYITDIAQLGNIESIGTDFTAQGVTIESNPTWRLVAASDATLGTTSGHQLRLVRSADYDWQQRIAGAGVVWYHNFQSADEVNAFRWAGGYGNDPNDVSKPSTVRWISTDYVTGGGCLEIYRPAGTTDGAVWWRPFSPIQAKAGSVLGNGRTSADPGAGITPRAWNPTTSSTTQTHSVGSYGNPTYQNANFDGYGYYLQMRVKTSAARFLASQPTGGKRIYLSRCEQSLTSQEIVWESKQNPSPYNYFSLYRSGGTPLEGDASNGSQPGNENNTPGPVCSFTGDTTNCWQMEPDTWETYLFHIVPGLQGANDGVVQVWAAHEGETSYTKIWDMSTMLSTYESGNEKGFNALICSGYMNGQNMTAAFYHRFDEIIFSTQTIPCPQV